MFKGMTTWIKQKVSFGLNKIFLDIIRHQNEFNNLITKLRAHDDHAKRQGTAKMIQSRGFLEDFRQSKFRETVSILNELKNLNPNTVNSLSYYQFREQDEQYDVISNIKKDYRGTLSFETNLLSFPNTAFIEGIFDPSRMVAIEEKQAAIRKNVGRKKKWNNVSTSMRMPTHL